MRFETFGPPEVLRVEDVPDPVPGTGQVTVRLTAAGLNMSDVYRRQGRYEIEGRAPWTLGYEGAGVVVAVGPQVGDLSVGDRVAFADVPHANAELVVAPTDRLVPVPHDIALEQAAAVLLQGLTAQFLCEDSFAAAGGHRAVVLAAGGGVGLLLVQLLVSKGVEVLAVTSSEPKRRAALAAGAQSALGYDEWSKGGYGGPRPDVVFDSVGTTLADSLAAVRIGGTVVTFGFAGGAAPPVAPRMLLDRSLNLVGGDLWNVLVSHRARVERATRLFDQVRTGQFELRVAGTYGFAEAAAAHEALETRTVVGKLLLCP